MINAILLTSSSSSSYLIFPSFQKPSTFAHKLNITNINSNVLLKSSIIDKLNNMTFKFTSLSD